MGGREQKRTRRGFTLLEMMIGLAIVAVLASLALPSLSATIARQRLKAAAEMLSADLAEARHEAARRGLPLHLHFKTTASWCWATTTTSGCDCATAQQCTVKATRAADHPGVLLVDAADVRFDPEGGGSANSAVIQGHALLQSARGEQLRVSLTRLGRAKVCAPGGELRGYPRC